MAMSVRKWLRGVGGEVDKLSLFNTVIFIFVGIVNTITGILRGSDYLYYLAYSFPFLIFTIINIKTKNKLLVGIIYSAIGIISIITSNMGEFSGIVFIIFSAYLLKNIWFEIILLFLSVISLMVSTYFDGQTTFQSFLMLSVYTYIYLIYFFTIRADQKSLEFGNASLTINKNIYLIPHEKQLLNLMAQGKNYKEIAEIFEKSQNTITTWKSALFVKFQAESNEQLMFKFGLYSKLLVDRNVDDK